MYNFYLGEKFNVYVCCTTKHNQCLKEGKLERHGNTTTTNSKSTFYVKES